MPRVKYENYTCPRCKYNTPHKARMRLHLFERAAVCPTIAQESIELTNEIKEHVMNYRVYHPAAHNKQSDTAKTVNNFINNYNTVNNFIANMDTFDKLEKLTGYIQTPLISFDDAVDGKYQNHRGKLEKDDFKYGFELDTNDLFQTINEVSQVCDMDTLQDFNLFYDAKMDKLKMYDSGAWKELLAARGIQRIIQTIQDSFWNQYECYLLRRIHSPCTTAIVAARQKELLEEYFKFIGSLDGIEPYCKNKSNSDILYSASDDRYDPHDEDYSISDVFYASFSHIREKVTRSDMNRVKSEVMKIIKKNSMKSVLDLNKKVLDLFNMDETFKEMILQSNQTTKS